MLRDMWAEFWLGVADALRRFDELHKPQRTGSFRDPVQGVLYSSVPDPRIAEQNQIAAEFYRKRIGNV